MSFTDTAFLFLFLPTVLFFYYIGWKPLRPYLLLAASLFFYACGARQYVVLLIVSVMVNTVLGWSIAYFADSKRIAMLLLFAGVFYNVIVLANYKYADFFGENLAGLFGREYEAGGAALPLGLSFFTFKAISYLADVYKGKIKPGKNMLYPALYLSFFAQVQSGPLSRYDTIEPPKLQGGGYDCTWDRFSSGVTRFIIGFNKKILLANTLCEIADAVYASDMTVLSTGYAWLGAVCYSLQLYYDFSGYSDMAAGLSWMFGLDCPENFHYPYMTKSVSEFWRRWHITLGSWFRDYIYIPLGGSRVESRWRLYLNLLAVWLLTGLWHGADWTFVVWGFAYFLAVAFEKTTGLPERFTKKVPGIVYRIFTLLFIHFMWVIFRADDMPMALTFISRMFAGAANPAEDARALFLLRDNLVFVAAAVLFCMPAGAWIQEWVHAGMDQAAKRKYRMYQAVDSVLQILSAGVNLFLFLWAVSYVVAGANNPFAYANSEI